MPRPTPTRREEGMVGWLTLLSPSTRVPETAYLCSSSSSSLVIILLYWLPLSCPGLYLKEKAAPVGTVGKFSATSGS